MVAELVVFTGTMDCCKSTLALQMDLWGLTVSARVALGGLEHLIVDEAQFCRPRQVEALCWCGRRATHNARVVDGTMVVEGDQVVVGDMGEHSMHGEAAHDPEHADLVEYEVLCRWHFMRRTSSHAARSCGAEQMPYGLDVCPLLPSVFGAAA